MKKWFLKKAALDHVAVGLLSNRRHQNMVRTSETNLAAPCVPLFLRLPHFDVICDLLINRRMTTLQH